MAAAQRRLGYRVGVISQEDPQRIAAVHRFIEHTRPGASQLFHIEPVAGALQRRLGFAVSKAVAHAIDGASVLHIHGLWNSSSFLAARQATRLNVPYVLRPAGMLEPWCIAQKPVRKRLALSAGYRQMINRAAAVHATSQQEASNIRQLGITAPVAVIPHGVETPDSLPAELHARRAAGGRRTLLFLSRVEPKKGLLPLIEAWTAVQAGFENWRLVIAGPDEGSHTAEVQAAAIRAGAQRVEFAGPVYKEAKSKLLAESHLLVLPTFSENFGVVVAEALAAGLPAITTTAAPWSELQTHNCGWWIDAGPAPLAAALRTAMTTTCHMRRAMGERGFELVRNQYGWPTAAARTIELYRWIAGAAAQPDFVDVEPSASLSSHSASRLSSRLSQHGRRAA